MPKSVGYASFEIRCSRLESFHVNFLSDDIKLQTSELAWFSFDLCQSFRQSPLCKSLRTVKCFLFDKWLKKLHNLERLYIGHCWIRSGKMLRYFPRLKLLYIQAGHESFLRSIEQEKRHLKSGCQLFFAGSAELDARLLDYTRSALRSLTSDYLTACYSKGASKVSPVFPFAARFELDRKYLAIWQEDRQFSLRFADSIRVLQIRPHLLPQHSVTELIRQFGRVIYLQVQANTFNQRFYDALPDAFAHLRSLEIDNTYLTQPELDLKFLLRFAELYRVKLARSINFNLNDQLILHRVNEKRKKIKSASGSLSYRVEKNFCTSFRDCF